jgi:hypothetical protein
VAGDGITLNGATAGPGLVTVAAGSHTIGAPLTIGSNATVDVASGTALTLSGALAVGAGKTITKSSAGGLTISGTVTAGAGSALAMNAGTTTLASDPTANLNITATGASTLANFSANSGAGIQTRNAAGLMITGSAKVALLTPAAHANRTLLSTGGLSIAGSAGAWTGTMDIGGNDMIVHNGSVATLTAQARNGLNLGGTMWAGTGLTSSAAAADANQIQAIGIIQNDNGIDGKLYGTGSAKGLFDGQDAATTDVLVKNTFFGDTDVSGDINAADYSATDNGYAMGLTGWFNGDFNYDGSVNAADYSLIDSAFMLQSTDGGPLASATPQAAVLAALPTGRASAVPEPATAGFLVASAFAAARRRRSRH